MNNKSAVFIALVVCAFALAQSAVLPESQEVKIGMKNAFLTGLERFGGSVKKQDSYVPKPSANDTRVFSLYTKGLNALGGGKPSLTEQYRAHHYSPIPPKVVRDEIKIIGEKPTAAEAAKIYIPRPDLQYTTDRLYN